MTSYLSPGAVAPVAGAGAGAVCGPAASYAMGVTHLGTTPTALTNSGAAKTDSSHASVAGNGGSSAPPRWRQDAVVVSRAHAATTSASVNPLPINTAPFSFDFKAVSSVPRNVFKAALASVSFAASYVTPRAAPTATRG